MYLILKNIHMSFALISFSGFLLRSLLMFSGSSILQKKWAQILPHIIDTVFLLSGFSMAFMLNFGLFTQAWLAMKILMLMFYLLFVGLALSRGRTLLVRSTSFVLAILTFFYIVGIAINKHPLGWFVLL